MVGWDQGIWMLLVGLGAGLIGGLLGVGGGIVMIPAMILILGECFGQNSFHLYKLAAITTSIFVAIPAAWRHAHAGALVRPLLRGIVPPSIAGIVVGVAAAALFDGEQTQILRRVFGGFLLLVVGTHLYLRRSAGSAHPTRDRCPIARRHALYGLLVGLPAGLIAGLLGIGGGAWAVPAQHLGLGVRMRNAIANSTAMILFIAPATAAALTISIARMEAVSSLTGFGLAAWLAPGALVGGWFGAGLTHAWPIRWVRLAFHVLLALTGLRLLLS